MKASEVLFLTVTLPRASSRFFVAWLHELPVERFISKVTQMYAYETIISKTKEDGYQIVEQKNQNDGSIELVLTKWDN